MNPPDTPALYGVTLRTPEGAGKAKRRRIPEKFRKRQQARQWCRNHWHTVEHDGMEITHPNRPVEPFKWRGIL